nr:nose resistant to fluoxetine protein 6-like [Lytechinus pictus]
MVSTGNGGFQQAPPCVHVSFVDSFGKPAAGILAGNLAWLGHFDQCMEIESYRHCLVGMQANLTSLFGFSTVLPIQWGVCAPEACSEEDVRNSLELLLGILDIPWLSIRNMLTSAAHCTEKPNTDFNIGFIMACVLISTLFALTILGSVVDYCLKRSSEVNRCNPSGEANGGHEVKGQGSQQQQSGKASNLYDQLAVDHEDGNKITNEKNEKTPLLTSVVPASTSNSVLSVDIKHNKTPNIVTRIVLCFAMTRNVPKLLNTKQAEGGIPCLNGIRVISISWVILGHTLGFILQAQANENFISVLPRWLDVFAFQAIANAFLSVDTFFFLSGLLLTFHTLKRMKETGGKIPWLWFYIHRYIRLTPTLALLILVLTFVLPNLNQGPVWFKYDQTLGFCKNYWWTDLLYINNFVPDGQRDCVSWGWYLANDMQFFIISPLFILPLFWFPVLGMIALAVTCAASFITISVLVYQNDFLPGLFLSIAGFFASGSGANLNVDLAFQKLIYVKPYCRIPPYLVGMAMGYFICEMESRRRRIKLSPVLAATGWAISAGLGVVVVYGLYNANRGVSNPTTAASIAYNSLSTFTWAIALCWVVFSCHYGYAGIINDFLSWSFWVPLSRLTYAAYLFHPVVMYTYSYAQAVPFHWSMITLIYMFASFLLLSHVVALLVTLILEFPIGNLEKILRQAASGKSRAKGQNDTKP